MTSRPPDQSDREGPGRRKIDEQRADRLGRLEQWLPVLIVFCLFGLAVNAVISTVVLVQQDEVTHNAGRLEAVADRLDAATLGACERVQDVRDDVNVLGHIVYLVLSQASEATPSEQAREAYRQLADSTTYVPPTDCPAAVGKPREYESPPALPFGRVAPCFTPRTPRPVVPCQPRRANP